MAKNNYTFGNCKFCSKYDALNNGICASCKDNEDVPDFLKDLFDRFDDENKRKE